MALGLFEGPVLGAALRELVDLVKRVRTRCSEFKSNLEGLENTLNLICPLIEETEELNSNAMQPLLDHLKTGKELVQKCSEISEWDLYKKNTMSDQLTAYKQKMFELFVPYLAMLTIRNTFKTSETLDRLCRIFESSRDDCISVLKINNLLDPWEVSDEPFWQPVGLAQPLKELKTMLLKSEKVVHVLSAPGGSGKTTLAKALCKDDDVKGKFGTNIFAVTVTKTPNVMMIIRTLLKQMQNQVSDIEVPDNFASETKAFIHFKNSVKKILEPPCGRPDLEEHEARGEEIFGPYLINFFLGPLIKQIKKIWLLLIDLINPWNFWARGSPPGGSMLCILDDVWTVSETLELQRESESLFEKFKLQIQGYKVLITSRYVFPEFENTTYMLKLLSDADASTLFCHSAFSPKDTSNSIPEEVVKEIVRKCKNNPLALKVIGRSLRGQPLEVWKSRIDIWSQCLFGTENDLLDSLGASLDALGENDVLKDCFFDLSSFPEDSIINVPALVDMWMELYKLNEYAVMCQIKNLFNRCLVDLVIKRQNGRDLYGYYNDRFITQHDILRELAIYRSMQDPVEQRKRLIIDMRGDSNPEWLAKLGKQTIQAQLVSISTVTADENFTSKWRNWDVKLSGVEVLVLNLSSREYSLPNFIENMKKLKVLVIKNHGVWPTELSNFLILRSNKVLRRIRLENVLLLSAKNVSSIDNYRLKPAKQVKNLKKISLVMCSIGEAFNNCSARLSDMLPELEEIDVDYCNDLTKLPSQLCNLSHLTKLSITNCPKLKQLPDRIGDLGETLLVLSLHACIELSTLPDSINSLHKLTILDISECLSLGNLPEKMGDMNDLKELHMKGCLNLSKLPASIFRLPHLKNVYCDEETACLWTSCDEETHVKVNVLPETVNLKWLGLGGLH